MIFTWYNFYIVQFSRGAIYAFKAESSWNYKVMNLILKSKQIVRKHNAILLNMIFAYFYSAIFALTQTQTKQNLN